MATARSHNTNPMNLLSTSGFACLGAFLNIHVFGVYRRIHQHFLVRVYRGVKFVSLAADCIYIHIYIYILYIYALPRLAVACLLKCRVGRFLAMFAIKCSSFTAINQGTSNRSACSSTGHEDYQSVSTSNCLLERTLPCIYIVYIYILYIYISREREREVFMGANLFHIYIYINK